ncbi:hypothetical protein B5M09_012283 [Aphanomyces astaci]|uniref:Uncharacterized protein n=1 Tax=Aphanomyces astaci TaxID=112090 RepID=A0A425D412_APHAT|nr:hypothetical protein B5M09_012283 [Aphanomyces astaci]
MSHAVEVLLVHEKDQQHCTYDKTHDAESAVPAKNCLYLDLPQYFRFDQKTKLWVGRKNHIKVIVRIDSVSPCQKERFYIRTLLYHRTLYPSYEEAAMSMGLLENDEEYVVYIRQATLDCMDGQLQELFANILAHCLPANTRALFDQFKADFMDKRLRDLRRCNETLPEPLRDDMILGKAMFYSR